MIGAVIGDIVGSIYEFNNHRSKEFKLFGKGCFATDDSIMTIAVAKALLECKEDFRTWERSQSNACRNLAGGILIVALVDRSLNGYLPRTQNQTTALAMEQL